MLFVGVIAIPAVVLAAAFRRLGQERVRVEQEFGARIRADSAQVAGRLDEAVERLVPGAVWRWRYGTGKCRGDRWRL